jgi:hypothetical protein
MPYNWRGFKLIGCGSGLYRTQFKQQSTAKQLILNQSYKKNYLINSDRTEQVGNKKSFRKFYFQRLRYQGEK